MTTRFALMIALVLAALACQPVPAASPEEEPLIPTPPPHPTSARVAEGPTPIALTDLEVVELGSGYRPTDISGDRSAGIGRDGEIYLVNVRTGEMRQLTNDGHWKREPVVSGELVAWTEQSRGIETHDNDSRTGKGLADDVFVFDLGTGEKRRITDVPAKRRGLQISGNRLVWMDNRNEFGEHYTHYDIYAYDLAADEEEEVVVAPGSQRSVAIEGDRIVWADNRNSSIQGTDRSGCFECPDNRFDIYLYDFTTGEERVLDESGANNRMPDIHGHRVVWRDFDEEGRTAIHLYDLDTGGRSTLVSPSLSGVDRPLLSGDHVVWTVGRPCDVVNVPSSDVPTGVFALDLRTDEVKQLSNYVEPSITLDGTVVVIHEGCQVTGHVYAVFLGHSAETSESGRSAPRGSRESGDTQQPDAGSESSSDTPVLDLDYDDSWVANVPDVIGGYRVVRIGTPRTVACSRSPMITLLAPQDSMDEFLANVPDVRSLLQSVPGVPSDVQLSFAGSDLDEEEASEKLARWNERSLKSGCIRLGGLELE